tara:strand:+ start:21745 stop:22452 length:708 start_codon:yes stop_codon:yes gene_type:complete
MSQKKSLFIIQSNYIPWKGYFDALNKADLVIIYDEMQFTKNDWRNRNMIKTQNGAEWLTIPVKQSGQFGQKINETEVFNEIWKKKHWKTIKQNYSKANYFQEIGSLLEPLYMGDGMLTKNLSEINVTFIEKINEYLGIESELVLSKNVDLIGDKNERIINLCREFNITDYISGPAAREYMDMKAFENAGIEVEFLNYSGYAEYHQLFGSFVHHVSIVDLLFNEGKDAVNYMKYFK